MARSLPYPVYDADNHLYESQEAMTAHLPKQWRREFQYIDVGGKKKLAIGGTLSEFVPNPTFEVLAAPGKHERWYRENTEGLTLRELTGKPIPCPPAYRNGADRLKLMDEQGISASLMIPTLASAVEERMSYDHELLNAVLHSLNEWLHAEWGFHREERIYAVPFITLADLDLAVAELEWALARGARTVGLRGARAVRLRLPAPGRARGPALVPRRARELRPRAPAAHHEQQPAGAPQSAEVRQEEKWRWSTCSTRPRTASRRSR
jgi:hypothetical protein